MKCSYVSVLAVAAIFLFSGSVLADGMIVPVRPELRVSGNWMVKYHHVDIKVRDQVASVSISQEFVNTGSGMIEVEYLFPVPPSAAIDSMTLIVGDKEFPATLYKADEARKIYEDIVRKKKDPALLEYVGFGLYKTSAFPLEPNKPAKVVVTYKYICRRDAGLVEVWYPLNTEKFSARPIESVEVKADIKSDSDITTIYSPSHDLTTERKDSRHVIATYSAKNVVPVADFQVFYNVSGDSAVTATMLSHQPDKAKDGYFMLLVSPNPGQGAEKAVAKDIVVSIDHSGSMSGEKLAQAKEAATYILKHLNPKDRFNIVFYCDNVQTLSDELQEASERNISAALARLDRTESTGSTNIYEALQTTIKLFGEDKEVLRPRYAIFLTDGLPTAYPPGKKESDIITDTKKSNSLGIRLFTFGVGYDVNVHLLDQLVADNGGRSDYVKPKEPIEGKVTSLYRKIRNPVMTGLNVAMPGLRIHDTYPHDLGDLYEGDQMVVVGRFFGEDVSKLPSEETGVYQVQLEVSGVYEGKKQTFKYPVEIKPATNDPTLGFVEKLWAIRRAGYLLDQISFHGENKELVDELISLSKSYGIMTPYTSFLADENTKLNKDRTELRADAAKKLEELKVSSGDVGQRSAVNRQQLNNAPMYKFAAASSAPGGKGGTAVAGFDDKESYETGKPKENIATVRQIGNKAIYRRGNQWITPEAGKLDQVKDADKIKVIQQYTPEYFELVRMNTTEENQILSQQGQGEEMLITLRNQTYLIKSN